MKNRQQAAVDEAVKAAKARKKIVAWADRGKVAPDSLSLEEIKSVCEFAMEHAECWEPGRYK